MATLTTSSKRPYHIIVFGATGFTGQFVVEEVARTCTEGPGGSLHWAVAGRNRERLEKLLIQAADTLCMCSAVPFMINVNRFNVTMDVTMSVYFTRSFIKIHNMCYLHYYIPS